MRLRVYSKQAPYEWHTAAPQFRIGRGDECDLRFEGDSSSFASWEHAEFYLAEDGVWYVTDLGSSNGTYLDGAPVTGPAALHLGSIVQVGRAGPRLEVLELSASASGSQGAALAPQKAPAAAAPVARQSAATAPPANSAATWLQRNLAVVIATAAVALLGIVLVSQGFFSRAADAPAADHQAAANGETAATSNDKSADPAVAPLAANQPSVPPPAITPNPSVQPAAAPAVENDRWKLVKERGLPAYRLILVEDPKTQASWPFAGAVAISQQALLTTATVGVELQKFLDREWRVAVAPDPQQTPVDIKSVRVHAAFQHETGAEQLYFDMAILDVAEPLTGFVQMASPAELAGLETGQPLACVAIDHAGDPIDRFQELRPQIYSSNLFAVTGLPPQPGGPQLLHLRGEISAKAGGSPIFDDQGRLIALYCEPAPSKEGEGVKLHISYAKLIEPELISLALSDPNNKIWVAPVATPAKQP